MKMQVKEAVELMKPNWNRVSRLPTKAQEVTDSVGATTVIRFLQLK